MKLLVLLGKVALATVVAAAGLAFYGKIRQAQAKSAASRPVAAAKVSRDQLSPEGFFFFGETEEKNPRVIVMTPANCPGQDAQRAQALVELLGQAGVPVEVRSGISMAFTDPSEAERVSRHMENAAIPIVIVRGWAKGAPTYDQVLAEYNRSR